MSTVEIRQLSIAVAQTGAKAVDNVSLEVSAGEIRGLVGESGCGKTAVAHSLLGYVRRGLCFSGGEVRIEGFDLVAASSEERRKMRGHKVTYVPQDPASALNPGLKIATQMRLALGRVPDGEIAASLEQVRLDDPKRILESYPHQLSGGQQQRVMLAMAFTPRPAVIVLDEPTTGLDVTTQRHVLNTIRELCSASGVTAIYVTHDLAVVKELADQITVMYAGEVIEDGPSDAVFGAPRHHYSAGLIGAAPMIGTRTPLRGIEGQQPRPGERGDSCLFAPRCVSVSATCLQERPVLRDIDERLVRCVAPIVGNTVTAEGTFEEADRNGAGKVLSVRGLEARYGQRVVLAEIDLSVADGECVAIVGESGSGKTTLARCIAGLHPFSGGEVSLNEEPLPPELRRRTRETLRRVQYVFQNPYASLNPRRTIGQSIGQALTDFQNTSPAEVKSRVADVLDAVALGERYAERFPGQLSGGERQRAAVARALVVNPDVLVCDEVTSALDVSVQAVIIELLRSLQQERELALLFITHNMALVSNIAQRVVVLHNGRIVEAGGVTEVLENPSTGYTQQLVADIL